MRSSDWSSDVCSSDLERVREFGIVEHDVGRLAAKLEEDALQRLRRRFHDPPPGARGSGEGAEVPPRVGDELLAQAGLFGRSVEPRVGKEGVNTCSSRWSPAH